MGMVSVVPGAFIVAFRLAAIPSIAIEYRRPRAAGSALLNVVHETNVCVEHHFGTVGVGISRGPVQQWWVYRHLSWGPGSAH